MVIAGVCAEPSFRTHWPFFTNRASSLGCGSRPLAAEVAAAHRASRAGHAHGKIVLLP